MAGIDNNTLLYLRGDSFTDLSLEPKSITNVGIEIDEGKFGNGFKCSTNKYISINNSNNIFTFGNSDFTIDFFIKFNSFFDNLGVFTPMGDTAWVNKIGSWHIISGSNRRIHFDYYSTTNNVVSLSSDFLTENIWYHIALVVKDTIVSLYVNGVKQGSISLSVPLIAQSKILISKHDGANQINLQGYLDEFRISNIARYTEDFTPPTQPYNSITINKTNQTDTNIEFNIEKLGQETINKVEVLVNGTVSETYTDSYDNINYLIDTDLCVLGNNDITIRVTYDDVYTEELSLTHNVTVNPLPLETPLLDTVERVKLLTKSKQTEKNMLSNILTSKNVEVTEEDKMSDLIGKVNELRDVGEIGIIIDESVSSTKYMCSYIENMSIDKLNNYLSKLKVCGFKNGEVYKYINANSDYSLYEDGTSVDTDVDVMIEIPKIYWKFEKKDSLVYIYLSEKYKDGYCCLAHTVGNTEKDNIYVSAFLGSNVGGKLRSLKSNSSYVVNCAINTSRNYAQANGNGYQQMTFYVLQLLNILYLLKKGFIPTVGEQDTNFLNIQDFPKSNRNIWIDCLGTNSSGHFMISRNNEFNDGFTNYTNYGLLCNTGKAGYLKSISATNETCFLPTNIDGSNSTYYAAYYILHTNRVAFTDNLFKQSMTYWTTDAKDNSGARLVYIGTDNGLPKG